MMDDPKRLLELSGDDSAGALERELLSSLKPPLGARDAVWQRLAAPGVLLIGASAAGVTAAAKASASTGAVAGSSFFTTAKLGILLAVAAPVAAGAIYVAKSSPPSPQPTAPVAAVVTPAPKSEPREEVVDVAPRAEPAEIAKAPSAERSSERERQSAISEENRLLREARAASRAGDAAGALATLRVLDRRFPGGALVQERELLRVQALRAQGSNAEAEQRARRFLRLYPTSPYASHMKASLETKAP
ncbi:MAG TPA: outer membrane protein assembly factor BamD [Polyangiaceae bacterium]|nr:outer membrane protein assembly factor BamD [Polyangiaceae bacterium]